MAENFFIALPNQTEILKMPALEKIKDPHSYIPEKLLKPIGSEPLPTIVRKKLKENSDAKATIVISDNTRPVPYRGESGILWPVVDTLIKSGVKKSNILLLIANGTHHELNESAFRNMLDELIFLIF